MLQPGGLFLNFEIKLFDAFQADAVRKFGFGMILDISFQSIPIAFIIANFFTISADSSKPLNVLTLAMVCFSSVISNPTFQPSIGKYPDKFDLAMVFSEPSLLRNFHSPCAAVSSAESSVLSGINNSKTCGLSLISDAL